MKFSTRPLENSGTEMPDVIADEMAEKLRN